MNATCGRPGAAGRRGAGRRNRWRHIPGAGNVRVAPIAKRDPGRCRPWPSYGRARSRSMRTRRPARDLGFPRPDCPSCAGPLVFWPGYRRYVREAGRYWNLDKFDELAQQVPLVRFARLSLLKAGDVLAAGMRLEPTGRNPRHFTVGFDDLERGVRDVLRAGSVRDCSTATMPGSSRCGPADTQCKRAPVTLVGCRCCRNWSRLPALYQRSGLLVAEWRHGQGPWSGRLPG